MSSPHDDPLQALQELPIHDLGSLPSASLQRRGRAAFARAHAPRPQSRWTALSRLYTRAFEPLAVAGIAAVYLAWAFQEVINLHA